MFLKLLSVSLYITYKSFRNIVHNLSYLFPSTLHTGGSVVYRLEFLPTTSEAAGSNLRPGTSCWKVGSYLPMLGGLQCSMHWFPPPVNYPSQYDPGC